jgi:hypothetical protein
MRLNDKRWNINLPAENGETSVKIPVYPGSRLVIIKASQAPLFIGETNSFGDTRLNSIEKRNFTYEIKFGQHLIIEKNDKHKNLQVEIDFI